MSSPFQRLVDPDRRRITIRLDGVITDDDVRAYFQQNPAEEAVAANPDFDRLLDLTGITGELSLTLVRSVAEGMRVSRQTFRARYAVVAPTDSAFGLMQTLVRLAFEDTQRARVFRSREGAEAWLSLEPKR